MGPSALEGEKGSILIICLLLLVMLSMLGVYSINISSTEVRIAANAKQAVEAFYAAESGEEEARARLYEIVYGASPTTSWRAFLGDGSLASIPQIASRLSGYSDSLRIDSAQSQLRYLVQIRHKTEADAGIDLCGDGLQSNDIRYWGDVDGDGIFEENPTICGGPTAGDPIEIITSWGISGMGIVVSSSFPFWKILPSIVDLAHASSNPSFAIKSVTVEEKREPLHYAVYGDLSVDLKNNALIGVSGSGGNIADVGTNGTLTIHNRAEIWGRVDLGAQEDGTPAALIILGPPGGDIRGGIHHVDRIDSDPLGIRGGILATEFEKYRTTNDNLTGASPPITDNAIILKKHGSSCTPLTLRPGNYYLTSITLYRSCSLIVDNATGPVNIYLDGDLEAKNGSSVTVTGSAANFRIYVLSSSSIVFKHSSDFTGCIYAPNASIEIKNSGNVTGMIWGKNVEIKNTGSMLYDPGVRNAFFGKRSYVSSWRED